MLVPLFLRYIIPSCGTLIFPDFSRKNTPIVFSGFVWFSRLCHGFAGVLSSRFLGVRSGFKGWILPLLHPCFILASTRSHAAFSRLSRGFTEEYSRRRFPFVRPLFDSFFDWQNPTFKRAENLIKLNIQIGGNLSKPDF